jgi:hypothetical protein
MAPKMTNALNWPECTGIQYLISKRKINEADIIQMNNSCLVI